VVSSILDAGDHLRLICLLSVGEFFEAFVASVSARTSCWNASVHVRQYQMHKRASDKR